LFKRFKGSEVLEFKGFERSGFTRLETFARLGVDLLNPNVVTS